LPAARAAGYGGSARNFRRLVASQKALWRQENHRGRRPAVWSPGQYLVIDWGEIDWAGPGRLQVFCAVLAWCRVRFVRFALDQRAATTLRLLAECFETLGGVPGMVLADRMGCLKGAVVANRVVPTGEYLRFATHYGFRPDFCEAADPQSKGIVERLVGYAKSDLVVPGNTAGEPFDDLVTANVAAAAWCTQVNATLHSETNAVPIERLVVERELLGPLPSLRPSIGRALTRTVDRLSCVRFGSARYSVPIRLIGTQVRLRTDDGRLLVIMTGAGEVVAEHQLVAPGETSILDAHYGGPRPAVPARAVRPKTAAEQQFCALGPVAEAFLVGAVAAGNTRLGPELGELNTMAAAHGHEPFLDALSRATAFGRWRAADVRSILAAGAGTPTPAPAGDALILQLPVVPTRSLADYAVHPAVAEPETEAGEDSSEATGIGS
jgi:transposase